ncbi:MAG: hypothetical protein R2724_30495 [Bryobacterales bacterium]
MHTVIPDDIRVAMWQKLIYVEPFGVVGAAARVNAGRSGQCHRRGDWSRPPWRRS